MGTVVQQMSGRYSFPKKDIKLIARALMFLEQNFDHLKSGSTNDKKLKHTNKWFGFMPTYYEWLLYYNEHKAWTDRGAELFFKQYMAHMGFEVEEDKNKIYLKNFDRKTSDEMTVISALSKFMGMTRKDPNDKSSYAIRWRDENGDAWQDYLDQHQSNTRKLWSDSKLNGWRWVGDSSVEESPLINLTDYVFAAAMAMGDWHFKMESSKELYNRSIDPSGEVRVDKEELELFAEKVEKHIPKLTVSEKSRSVIYKDEIIDGKKVIVGTPSDKFFSEFYASAGRSSTKTQDAEADKEDELRLKQIEHMNRILFEGGE